MIEFQSKVLARLMAIEFMHANLYVHFCEKNEIPPEMIKAQNDELRQRMARNAGPPGVDPREFAASSELFQDAVQAILVQIEAMAASGKTAS